MTATVDRQLQLFATSTAALSSCRRYRYSLVRRWAPQLGDVNFIMLNPSTADAESDDPTIRRCLGYARRWRYGGIVVTNLFAWRATDPAELARAPDPIGPHNDRLLEDAARSARLVVCAWGNHGRLNDRARAVVRLLSFLQPVPLHCLAITGAGQPAHPLYQRGDLQAQRFTP